jgi:hypothetical protein
VCVRVSEKRRPIRPNVAITRALVLTRLACFNDPAEAIERSKYMILKLGIVVIADRVDDDEIEALEENLYWEPEGASVKWNIGADIAEALASGAN